jgi:hypothetical protein
MNKTNAICKIIAAYMIGRNSDVSLREIKDVLATLVSDREAKKAGLYIWHLENDNIIEVLGGGVYRVLLTPEAALSPLVVA